MSKYEAQLSNLKQQLSPAQNILVFLPSKVNVDKLAAGLATYLSLKQVGKNVSIVTEDTPLVSHSGLFGIGDVKNSLSLSQNDGNLILTLEDVVAEDGKVPALEKLDWFPQGKDLNLVFHVLPGQKFEPKNIAHKYSNSGFDLVFVIGAANPTELGSIYTSNIAQFSNVPLINIDNNSQNSRFGQTNVVDTNASSVSEIVTQVLPDLGLSMDADSASNLLSGIYAATSNLTTNVSGESFMMVGQLVQAGGKLPVGNVSQAPTSQPEQPQQAAPKNYIESTFDYKQFIQSPSNQSFTNEERPSGEYSNTPSPEVSQPAPDWLTPKVYKGSKVG